MLTSKEALLKEANTQNYKPEILEKVHRLLDIFGQILSVPYLQTRLVLKGGTALNLFYFDKLPRLSVDIDLNYVGQLQRDKMLEEKQIVIDAVHQVLLENNFERYRSPMHHAGGKMVWFYNSVLGQRGALEIDINFMYRLPLYPIMKQTAKLGAYKNLEVPVLDIHELAVGKLSALFSRNASRDLFDAHYLMTKMTLDIKKLRLAFVVYLAMSKIEMSTLANESIKYNLTDLKNRLFPVMHQLEIPRKMPDLKSWADNMISELRQGLEQILPLADNEIEFISTIRTTSQIKPELITEDETLIKIISSHPAVLWAIEQRKR